MASFVDNCGFIPTAGGTSDWTYSSTVGGYQSPTLAGAVNGTTYVVRAQSADLTQWEYAQGIYNSGTGVFPRTTVLYNSSGSGTLQGGAGTKIGFTSAPALVAIVALAQDLVPRSVQLGAATLNTTFTNPTATSSTSLVMMGTGGTCAIRPTFSGRLIVGFNYGASNSSGTSGGANYGIQYGTGTAPVNGAAVTGTQLGSRPNVSSASGNTFSVSQTGVVTGLTVGTLYWFDITMSVNSASQNIAPNSGSFFGAEF